MLKIICLVSAGTALCSTALAAPHERLSWDDVAGGELPAALEETLNACIAEDIRSRGYGAPCLALMDHVQPSGAHPDGSWSAVRDLNAFWFAYWDLRLNEAYLRLRATYQARNDVFEQAATLINQLRETQRHWINWRDAKCAFEGAYDPRGSRWRHLDPESCRMGLTAIRALELELMDATLSR